MSLNNEMDFNLMFANYSFELGKYVSSHSGSRCFNFFDIKSAMDDFLMFFILEIPCNILTDFVACQFIKNDSVYGNLTSAKSLFFSQLRIWLREGEVRINITLPVCLKLFDQSDFTTTRHDFSHFSNENKSFLVTSKFSFLHQKP